MHRRAVTPSFAKILPEDSFANQAETQLQSELDAFTREMEVLTNRYPAAEEEWARARRHVIIVSRLSKVFCVALFAIIITALFYAPVALRGSHSERCATPPSHSSDQVKICRALNRTATEIALLGNIQGLLLPTANYFKNGKKTFAPQLISLVAPEVKFPNKPLFLEALDTYADGLADCGESLRLNILQIDDWLRDVVFYLDYVHGELDSMAPVTQKLSGTRWSKSTERKQARASVHGVLHLIDQRVEDLASTISDIARKFNRTHHYGLLYYDNIDLVRDSIQNEIDQQGRFFWFQHWLAGTSRLHEARDSLIAWHYPTSNILTILEQAHFKLRNCQPFLWPIKGVHSSVNTTGWRIETPQELATIITQMRKARDELAGTVGRLMEVNAREERLLDLLSFAPRATIPIPSLCWTGLEHALDQVEPMQERLSIDGSKDERDEESN